MVTCVPGLMIAFTSLSRLSVVFTMSGLITWCCPSTLNSAKTNWKSLLRLMMRGSFNCVLQLIQPFWLPDLFVIFNLLCSATSKIQRVIPGIISPTTSLVRSSSARAVTRAIVSHVSPGLQTSASLLPRPVSFFLKAEEADENLETMLPTEDFEPVLPVLCFSHLSESDVEAVDLLFLSPADDEDGMLPLRASVWAKIWLP
mmetsp:Transcript_113537/g.308426  ORF Transcript_113537/g.308426 Transcript_113537/m.308426 type:complete len:201 (-) Transcript_113537:4-606(-)